MGPDDLKLDAWVLKAIDQAVQEGRVTLDRLVPNLGIGVPQVPKLMDHKADKFKQHRLGEVLALIDGRQEQLGVGPTLPILPANACGLAVPQHFKTFKPLIGVELVNTFECRND